MKFSKESLDKLRKIFKEEYNVELTDQELWESAFNLTGYFDLMMKCAYDDVQNYWRLEKEPNGYRPEGDKEYICALCRDQVPGNEGWIDKFGFKCKLCQKAVDDSVVPGSICRNRDTWFSRHDLRDKFGIQLSTARYLVRTGKLKSRTILNEVGKPHLIIFLREDNWEYLKIDKKAPKGRSLEYYDKDVARWAKELKEKSESRNKTDK